MVDTVTTVSLRMICVCHSDHEGRLASACTAVVQCCPRCHVSRALPEPGPVHHTAHRACCPGRHVSRVLPGPAQCPAQPTGPVAYPPEATGNWALCGRYIIIVRRRQGKQQGRGLYLRGRRFLPGGASPAESAPSLLCAGDRENSRAGGYTSGAVDFCLAGPRQQRAPRAGRHKSRCPPSPCRACPEAPPGQPMRRCPPACTAKSGHATLRSHITQT